MRFMLLITCQEQLLLHKTTAWWHSWADRFAKQKWISEEESRSVFDKQNTNTKIWQIQKSEQNLSICPYIHASFHLSICLPIRLSIYPSINPSIHLYVHPSVYLPSIRLSVVHLFICRPSIHLFFCPSVHLSSIHLHSLKTVKLQAF